MEQRITPMYLPEGPFIKYAEAFKAALDIPVIASGTIHDPKIGEKLVREGKADFVAFARPLFADPDLPNKLLTGMGDDVIPCIRCNTCVSREQKGARGRCAVNPRTGYENVIDVPAAIPLNVVVVGGGPAGIQAALTAARRGHKVTLYDKGDRLGGMIAVAAGVSFKAPMRRLLDYFNRSLEAAGVHVRLGMEITGADDLPGRQDVLVLATGAKIPVPDRFRRDGFPAISARDALGSNTRRSRRTVVVGANQIGIETACVLGQAGERVTLIERQDRFADDVNLIDNLVLPRMLEASGVTVRLGTKATSLVGSDVLLEGPKGNDRIAADRVVVAFGAVPDRSVLSTISAEMDLPIHTIGEAAGLFGLYWATHSGDHVGRLI